MYATYISAIIFLVVGVLLRFFSPKKRIWWYGYRTPSSMKSDASYVYANKLSGGIMIALSAIFFVATTYLPAQQQGWAIGGGVLLMILITEWMLYHFNKQISEDNSPPSA